MSLTKIKISAFWTIPFPTEKYCSWPAVSQIWIDISELSSSSLINLIFSIKCVETPIVDSTFSSNSFPSNLLIIEVFPTPDSPRNTALIL